MIDDYVLGSVYTKLKYILIRQGAGSYLPWLPCIITVKCNSPTFYIASDNTLMQMQYFTFNLSDTVHWAMEAAD